MDKHLKSITSELRLKAETFLNSRLVDPDRSSQETAAMEIIQELLAHQSALQLQNQQLHEAEKEFHKERDYYKDIFHNQPAGLYRIRVYQTYNQQGEDWKSSKNPPYSMEIASQRFCEILGVTQRDFSRNPYILADLVCDEDKDSFVARNEEANMKMIPFQWEGRLLIDHNHKWVRLESIPRLLSNGEILWTGILYDITKRKIAEEALKESEEKYRLLFVTNPQPMWIVDCDTHRFIEVNESAVIHYGYTNEEFLSMSTLDIRPADEIPIYLEDVDHIIAGQKMIGERRHLKKNGDVIYVEIVSSTVVYRGKLANHILISDITERKRAEDSLFNLNQELENRVAERTAELLAMNLSLHAAEEKFRTVADYTYNWEYWIGPDDTILYMSPSVERITGYTVEEFQQQPELINTIVYKEDRANWEEHRTCRCLEKSHSEVLEFIFRVTKKTGDVRWIAHICRCIHNEQGKCLGIRVSNRDVTENVENQNKLLHIAVDVAEQERNRFSRDLHDGLGPLLSAIKLYFQMLGSATDIEKKKVVEEKGNITIDRAIQTTRELARGLSSRFLSHLGYMHAIQDFVQQINESGKIAIHFTSNSTDRFSVILEVSLYRITTELINNSLVYARASVVDIDFMYDKITKMITLTYADNGIGFDWEEVQRREKGLGLMNIQQRAQILNGTFKLLTKPGAGMNAKMQFPVEGDIVSAC